jgi:hypothetical protein
MTDEADRVARGLNRIGRFTIKHVLSRRVIPVMTFEMTSNELRTARAAVVWGIAWKFGPFWGLTDFGLQVRDKLKGQ